MGLKRMKQMVVLGIILLAAVSIQGCSSMNQGQLYNAGEANDNVPAGFCDLPTDPSSVKTVMLVYDDLGARRNDGVVTPLERIYDLSGTDAAMEVAAGHCSELMFGDGGTEKVSLASFLSDTRFQEQKKALNTLKIYIAGIKPGSCEHGWVDDINLSALKDILADILTAYPQGTVISLNVMGAGTGAVGIKYLISTIPKDERLANRVVLQFGLLTEPVSDARYYSAADVGPLQAYPQILTRDAKITEFFASNGRDKALHVIPYYKSVQESWLEQKFQPGTHYQLTGATP